MMIICTMWNIDAYIYSFHYLFRNNLDRGIECMTRCLIDRMSCTIDHERVWGERDRWKCQNYWSVKPVESESNVLSFICFVAWKLGFLPKFIAPNKRQVELDGERQIAIAAQVGRRNAALSITLALFSAVHILDHMHSCTEPFKRIATLSRLDPGPVRNIKIGPGGLVKLNNSNN